MSIVAILQARTGSSRLPGKVLKDLFGRPMLARQIERVQRATRLDDLIVATTHLPEDDELASLCQTLGIACHRGPVDDVLKRMIGAMPPTAERIVRLTGDCPLADPEIIDDVIEFAVRDDYDYASNTLMPTYPDGLDVEVVRSSTLAAADREARLRSEREHVTPFIYKHPEFFTLGDMRATDDRSKMRWTVDEPQDFVFIERVYAELYPTNPSFGMMDILALMERSPNLQAINQGYKRNEGYAQSLKDDNL